MILTCNLPFIAVIVNKELWDTDVVRRLLFDFWFDEYDCRGLELGDTDVANLAGLIEFEGSNDITEKHKKDFIEKVLATRKIREKDFKEEDIIRLLELLDSEDIQAGLVPGISLGNEEPLLTTKIET